MERLVWLDGIAEEARTYFPRPCAHGWDHTQRVRALALHIARAERADMMVVEAAALLHDIGRDLADEHGTPHAYESEHLARAILAAHQCPPSTAEAIAHAVRAHTWSGPEQARTLEAKVLQDADRLDAIGAVGVARAYTRAGELGRGIDHGAKHFEDKLSKLAEAMNTPTGRKLARDRHSFLRQFMQRLAEELAEAQEGQGA